MSDYAAHGSHCNARTFPMQCKYCKQQVFFFSCDHGSKVFFDELGAPWKLHNCTERAIAILGEERVNQEIASRMMTPKITGDYEGYVKRGEAKRKKDPKWDEHDIIRQDPYPDLRAEEWGIIRELNLSVNIFKKLKIEDTPNWRSTLGKLVSEAQVQVTIHTGALGDEENNSFTFFVKQKVIKQRALTIGDFVKCRLVGHSIPGRDTIWVGEIYQSAYD